VCEKNRESRFFGGWKEFNPNGGAGHMNLGQGTQLEIKPEVKNRLFQKDAGTL